jgi:hypothetical protein
MRKIILCVTVLFMLSGIGYAETWCMWDGSKGTDCRDDSNGYIILTNGMPVSIDEENFNRHGYYRLIVTNPVLGADQVRDAEVWGFGGNEITKTWTVRDMTVTEIDIRDAGPMPLSEYYLWKVLHLKGVITTQEIQNNLPQELQDAYMARDRLENP